MRALTPDAVRFPTVRGSFVDGPQVSTIHAHDLPTIPSTSTRVPVMAGLAYNFAAMTFIHGAGVTCKARALDAASPLAVSSIV
jgi:hypothetical protein